MVLRFPTKSSISLFLVKASPEETAVPAETAVLLSSANLIMQAYQFDNSIYYPFVSATADTQVASDKMNYVNVYVHMLKKQTRKKWILAMYRFLSKNGQSLFSNSTQH